MSDNSIWKEENGASEDYEMLWQILSWQPLGGELMLECKDFGDLLVPYIVEQAESD